MEEGVRPPATRERHITRFSGRRREVGRRWSPNGDNCESLNLGSCELLALVHNLEQGTRGDSGI